MAGAASIFGISMPTQTSTFSTDFNLTEFPISENSAWNHVGLNWTKVRTANGLAFGSQTGSNGFDDSYAYLSGFSPDQEVTGVVHIENGITGPYVEIELLLRWNDSSNSSRGYECNLSHDGFYAQIVRWPGPLGNSIGDYTYLSSNGNGIGRTPQSGDIMRARISGFTISTFYTPISTGVEFLIDSITDTDVGNRISTGQPGIGFYWQGESGNQKFAWNSFTAKNL
jgi:hypothetical protein